MPQLKTLKMSDCLSSPTTSLCLHTLYRTSSNSFGTKTATLSSVSDLKEWRVKKLLQPAVYATHGHYNYNTQSFRIQTQQHIASRYPIHNLLQTNSTVVRGSYQVTTHTMACHYNLNLKNTVTPEALMACH